jgi:hypothetical protein
MTHSCSHAYALLIAVDQNAVRSAALPDVAKDVSALRDVLVHPDRCGYAVDNVRIITGPESTRVGIMQGLDWLREKLLATPDGNATALIYYTGHGHVDAGNYYLIPYDVHPSRIKTSAIRAEDFAADIAALQPQRLLVMLDCCHAAGMEIKDLTGAPPLHSTALPPALFMQGESRVKSDSGGKDYEGLAQGSGRAVLSSCQADEASYMRKDRRMSIFTYHLIEALTGHAQPQAGAGEVLVSDIMGHVSRRVPVSTHNDWNRSQQPDFQVSGNFPVALLLGGKGLSHGETAPDPFNLPQQAQFADQTYQAHLTGDGAIAQGHGATAIGAGGCYIGGSVNTGGGDFIGRNRISHTPQSK